MINWFKKKSKKVILNKKALLNYTDNYIVKGTHAIPSIDFRKDGICTISGYSRPEDLDGIYKDAKEFITELVRNNVKINFTFNFEYFNTTTQRYIYDLLRELNSQNKIGEVIWKYPDDDEDMEDMGKMYKSMYPRLKIKLIKK